MRWHTPEDLFVAQGEGRIAKTGNLTPRQAHLARLANPKGGGGSHPLDRPRNGRVSSQAQRSLQRPSSARSVRRSPPPGHRMGSPPSMSIMRQASPRPTWSPQLETAAKGVVAVGGGGSCEMLPPEGRSYGSATLPARPSSALATDGAAQRPEMAYFDSPVHLRSHRDAGLRPQGNYADSSPEITRSAEKALALNLSRASDAERDSVQLTPRGTPVQRRWQRPTPQASSAAAAVAPHVHAEQDAVAASASGTARFDARPSGLHAATSAAASSPVGSLPSAAEEAQRHLGHYRVMLELMTARCTSLEYRLEYNAACAARQQQVAEKGLRQLEAQAERLGLALQEQKSRSSLAMQESLEAAPSYDDYEGGNGRPYAADYPAPLQHSEAEPLAGTGEGSFAKPRTVAWHGAARPVVQRHAAEPEFRESLPSSMPWNEEVAAAAADTEEEGQTAAWVVETPAKTTRAQARHGQTTAAESPQQELSSLADGVTMVSSIAASPQDEEEAVSQLSCLLANPAVVVHERSSQLRLARNHPAVGEATIAASASVHERLEAVMLQEGGSRRPIERPLALPRAEGEEAPARSVPQPTLPEASALQPAAAPSRNPDGCWQTRATVPGLLLAALPRSPRKDMHEDAVAQPGPGRLPVRRAAPASAGAPNPLPPSPTFGHHFDVDAEGVCGGGSDSLRALAAAAREQALSLESPTGPAMDGSSPTSPEFLQKPQEQSSQGQSQEARLRGSLGGSPGGDSSSSMGTSSAAGSSVSGLWIPEELLRPTADPRQAARAWTRVGQAQQRQRNFNEARMAYQTAMQLDPGLHGCLANLAQLEAHAGNLVAAQELISQALTLDPSCASYQAFAQWLRKAVAHADVEST
eukprot:TRINITY_DN5330_c0_g1_i1.p1 TRINITY_DN5330_c0_g1~~TRINITY_DN5330_c0_g1_i1.p1  ORF type:complete len:868 (+),score=181.24 TRINITY_DN5330_c0_g1_i1:175-2778(+)